MQALPDGGGMLAIKTSEAVVQSLLNDCATLSPSVAAIAADADAARALEVPLGSPLLRVRAALTDDAGRVRAVLESLCRSDRLQLKMLERS